MRLPHRPLLRLLRYPAGWRRKRCRLVPYGRCTDSVYYYDVLTKRSDRSDGQPDQYRRTPVPVVSEDGGSAVMAAT